MMDDGKRAMATWRVQNALSLHDYFHAAGKELEELEEIWVSRSGAFAKTASFSTSDWVVLGMDNLRESYSEAKRRRSRALYLPTPRSIPALSTKIQTSVSAAIG